VFRNVLVAVDGSAHAQRALEEAIDLVRLGGGSLTLVTVVPKLSAWFQGPVAGLPPAADSAAAGPLPSDLARVRDGLVRDYRQLSEHAQSMVPDDVPSSALVLDGRPADAIISQVRAGGHDLVAMGSRGRGKLRSALLGSVSHQVVNDSAVPVLIVHLMDTGREESEVP
jgi:nucleotide-binding universal stress UspA family protein